MTKEQLFEVLTRLEQSTNRLNELTEQFKKETDEYRHDRPSEQLRDSDKVLRPFHLASDSECALRQDFSHNDRTPAESGGGGKSAI